MKNKIFFSIIVPVKNFNHYIEHDLIPALKEQSYQNFELIVVVDQKLTLKKARQYQKLAKFLKIITADARTAIETATDPASKRDLAVKQAHGQVLAFIDDDAYPDENWLQMATKYFQTSIKTSRGSAQNKQLAAICGPGLTPPNNNWRQQVSGLFWQSWLGAGAAGTYRSQPETKRFIDDYPSFNFFVKKTDFKKVGGFDTQYWPGEDTKFCHDLVYKLKKKIVYDPKLVVYHHRRKIMLAHLKQISRYGEQRGRFVWLFPKTSRKIGYFLPSLLALIIMIKLISSCLLAFTQFANHLQAFEQKLDLIHSLSTVILLPYSIALLATSFQAYQKNKKKRLAIFLIPTITLSHITYGIFFLKGLLKFTSKRE